MHRCTGRRTRREQDTGCAIAGGSEWTLPLQNCFRLSCVAKRNACPHTMGERGPTLTLSLGPMQPAFVLECNKMSSCMLLISGTQGPNCGGPGPGRRRRRSHYYALTEDNCAKQHTLIKSSRRSSADNFCRWAGKFLPRRRRRARRSRPQLQ